ncbi:conserved hypothetical protein [Ricinus communis]|uniref:Uncharacterized protein n=1 Tax=Ricinus communis TaxID=3988 RepID=B9S522_RICCO|nr:conserved hypothetical protein [Ricinus communis]
MEENFTFEARELQCYALLCFSATSKQWLKLMKLKREGPESEQEKEERSSSMEEKFTSKERELQWPFSAILSCHQQAVVEATSCQNPGANLSAINNINLDDLSDIVLAEHEAQKRDPPPEAAHSGVEDAQEHTPNLDNILDVVSIVDKEYIYLGCFLLHSFFCSGTIL